VTKQTSGSLVGIEVNSEYIIGCEVRPEIGRPVLKRLVVQPLKSQCIVDGEVVDQDELVEELKLFAAKSNFRGRGVITSIANPKVLVREILVPKMTAEELKSAMAYQAQEYIPMAIENSQIDFEVIGEVANPDGTKMMKVMLVAAQKDMVMEFARSFIRAGFNLKVVDVNAFALQRSLLEYPEPIIPEEDYVASSICLIDIGSDIATFTIIIGDRVKFVRFLDKAWDNFVDSISRELSCDLSLAKEHLMKVGLVMITKPIDFEDEADLKNKVIIGNAIRKTVDDFVDELRKTIDYYSVEEESLVISQVLISGIGARIEGFCDYISKSLGIDVKLGEPFKNLNTSKVDIAGADLVKDAPIFAVSAGLGLRGIEA
jgi:type IV pilus assembly protein PilM